MTSKTRLIVATALICAWSGVAHAEGDVEKGLKAFKKCKACHMVGENAKKRVGPPLNKIVDSIAGAQEGYKYSNAMTKAGEEGLTWTEENLHKYLTKPKGLVKGTKMSFSGMKKESDRANIIAYLKTFSE